MPGFLSIDTTSIMYYTVECRDRDTGYWTEEEEFKPDYRITKTVSPHRFLWFTWDTTLTECHNEDEAEDVARVAALRLARDLLRHSEVRVRSCDKYSDYDSWMTVWENGKFKDC